jgi:hypothetical protein
MMGYGPEKTEAFNLEVQRALMQSATVQFPYPPPAMGVLYLGINDLSDPELPGGTPEYFLRLVQVQGRSLAVTRILDLNEMTGLRFPREAGSMFRMVNEYAGEIKAAKEHLRDAQRYEPGVYEVLLFEDVVISVRETAQVLVRICLESGGTASETEDLERSLPSRSRCCTSPVVPGP